MDARVVVWQVTWRSQRICAVVAFCAMILTGCSQPKRTELPRLSAHEAPAAGAAPTYEVHPQSVYASFEGELARARPAVPAPTHKDYAMHAANQGMIDESLAQLESARRAVRGAESVMMGVVAGEEKKAGAAVLGKESAKVFKGECYEISMANAMAGLLSLRLQNTEEAAIGFRRALEADKMSKEDKRDDFELAYWGLGMVALEQRSADVSEADAMFRHCKFKNAATVQNENLVVLIELGAGPWKQLGGMYGESDTIVMTPYEPRSAEVFVDGQRLGKSFKLIDLYDQSRGVRRTGKDVGAVGKGIGKFALATLAGAVGGQNASNAVASAWNITADTRTCYMFPNEMHVVTAQVPPGLHTLNVKFYDAKGTELKRYEQVWHYVPAPTRGRQYISVRAECDRCNVQGPIPFTKILSVKKIKKQKKTNVQFNASDLPGVKVGDTLHICQFGQPPVQVWNSIAHWRIPPMMYNSAGEPVGRPGDGIRVLDYDIGLVGEAKVVQVDKKRATAEVMSLTTDYVPTSRDMVTNAHRKGRLWF